MTNSVIRNTCKQNHIKLWQLADELGLSDGNLSRLLRHELPDDKRDHILKLIEKIKEENEK